MKDRMPHPDHLLRIHDVFGVDLNWLLTGEGEPLFEEKTYKFSNNNFSDLIEFQKSDLIQCFIDIQRALNINLELFELEKLYSETFKRVESYIKGTLDTIKEIRKVTPYDGPDRRRGERRIEDQPDQIPDGQDRRSGLERRKVSGGNL